MITTSKLNNGIVCSRYLVVQYFWGRGTRRLGPKAEEPRVEDRRLGPRVEEHKHPILLTKTLCKENVKFLKHSYRVKRQVGTML